MKIELFKYGYYVLSKAKSFWQFNFWMYFQIGKYYLDEKWYENRIAFDFFFRGKHHIHYQWVRDHFDTELKKAFKELILTKGIFNPSFRKGDINKK